jgi:hypothetical protein
LIVFTITGVEGWFPLIPITKDDEIQGDLLVEIMIDEYTDELYRGVITLVEARLVNITYHVNRF